MIGMKQPRPKELVTRSGERLVSVNEGARRLGVHWSRIYVLVWEGTFSPAWWKNRRYIRVSELEAYSRRADRWHHEHGLIPPRRPVTIRHPVRERQPVA
jgi:hypothetical protein